MSRNITSIRINQAPETKVQQAIDCIPVNLKTQGDHVKRE